MLQFKVGWNCTCYECACPLEIYIVVNCISYDMVDEFFTQLFSWSYMKPLELFSNSRMFKYYGCIPVRKVCANCYHYPHRPDIRMREIGSRQNAKRNSSCSASMLYTWFKEFDEFRRRPDLDQYLIEESKLGYIPGIQFYLKINTVSFLH
jgi:hypothetical protein